jgi:hypothetical protein
VTHWRKLTDREYLGAWDVPKPTVATITAVTGTQLPGQGDVKASKKPVISFKNTEKKLIAGATICKAIAHMYGDDVEQWVGKPVTLYATTTRAKGGDQVDCVRVKPEIPTRPATGVMSQPVDEAMRAKQVEQAGGQMQQSAVREPGED